jgi:hypothetical protein
MNEPFIDTQGKMLNAVCLLGVTLAQGMHLMNGQADRVRGMLDELRFLTLNRFGAARTIQRVLVQVVIDEPILRDKTRHPRGEIKVRGHDPRCGSTSSHEIFLPEP